MENSKNILETLAYFDMFRYPVSISEIHRFLGRRCSLGDIQLSLNFMIARGMVYRFGEWYSLRNEPSLEQRRIEGNNKAEKILPMAYRIGKLLSAFPFVRGVGISGSLSKNFADQVSDVDFFIITETNRLWIARSLLHCLKKLSFLAGKQHWLCMNYFIDNAALQMPEKNIFIATEVVTLKPVSGPAISSFFAANHWAFAYFPNHLLQTFSTRTDVKHSWLKVCLETIFNNCFGNTIDTWLMLVTRRRWTKKESEKRVNMKGEPLALRIDKHYGRPNPEHFQKKILSLYDHRLQELQKKFYEEPAISYAMK